MLAKGLLKGSFYWVLHVGMHNVVATVVVSGTDPLMSFNEHIIWPKVASGECMALLAAMAYNILYYVHDAYLTVNIRIPETFLEIFLIRF